MCGATKSVIGFSGGVHSHLMVRLHNGQMMELNGEIFMKLCVHLCISVCSYCLSKKLSDVPLNRHSVSRSGLIL